MLKKTSSNETTGGIIESVEDVTPVVLRAMSECSAQARRNRLNNRGDLYAQPQLHVLLRAGGR